MRANELRIGNYFYDRSGKILKLDFWDYMKPAQKMFLEGSEVHPLTEDLEYCKPIPLTEDILLKCGFELANGSVSDFHLKIEGENLLWVDLGYEKISIATENDWVSFNGFNLHQLQNLYFALTGNEMLITN